MNAAALGSLLGGLALLVLGADALVRGAARLARRLGIGSLVVGLTVVAFGTSAPELVVSVSAALEDRADIALGNVVGSNIANILLVLALSALIRPVSVHAHVMRVDLPILIAVSAIGGAIALDGRIGRLTGAALAVALIAYAWSSVVRARREHSARVVAEFDEGLPRRPVTLVGQLAATLVGLGLLAWGADLFVAGAVAAARALGVSEIVIGLTVVAVGTSLPELASSLVATARGEGDIAVGNVVGSNIFNLLGIMGAAALARPLRGGALDPIDLVAMLAGALLLLPLARSAWRLTRVEGAMMLAGYAAWVAWRALSA